jgi:hypothetical protein
MIKAVRISSTFNATVQGIWVFGLLRIVGRVVALPNKGRIVLVDKA